ncbi:MAG: AAA family ATPase [bacterium]|nr:AAA family ATPase [bacterium]
MAQTIKILIAEANLETRVGLKKLLLTAPVLPGKEIEIVSEAEGVKEVEVLAAKSSPDIILMSTNLKDIGGVEVSCRIAQTFVNSSVIIISEHPLSQDELKKAMLSGIRSFLVQPIDQQELHKVIGEIFELNSQRREKLPGATVSVPVDKPKIIAMFGAKGGVGRTLISTNLAVSMAESLKPQNKKIALIDLDLQFGDIAIMLNLTPAKTIVGLSKEINELGNIDEELLESYLIKYRDNLAVLPAPLKPEEADLIQAEHIERILDLIKNRYHYTIVDCSRTLSESILVALGMADTIILLLTMDIPTIKNAKLSLEVMEKLGFSPKIKIVLNRAYTKMGISIAEVKEALASPIMELIPSDGRVAIPSVNEGIPFVIKYPKSNISKSIKSLADKIVESPDKIKPKKWWK